MRVFSSASNAPRLGARRMKPALAVVVVALLSFRPLTHCHRHVAGKLHQGLPGSSAGSGRSYDLPSRTAPPGARAVLARAQAAARRRVACGGPGTGVRAARGKGGRDRLGVELQRRRRLGVAPHLPRGAPGPGHRGRGGGLALHGASHQVHRAVGGRHRGVRRHRLGSTLPTGWPRVLRGHRNGRDRPPLPFPAGRLTLDQVAGALADIDVDADDLRTHRSARGCRWYRVGARRPVVGEDLRPRRPRRPAARPNVVLALVRGATSHVGRGREQVEHEASAPRSPSEAGSPCSRSWLPGWLQQRRPARDRDHRSAAPLARSARSTTSPGAHLARSHAAPRPGVAHGLEAPRIVITPDGAPAFGDFGMRRWRYRRRHQGRPGAAPDRDGAGCESRTGRVGRAGRAGRVDSSRSFPPTGCGHRQTRREIKSGSGISVT